MIHWNKTAGQIYIQHINMQYVSRVTLLDEVHSHILGTNLRLRGYLTL